MVEENLQNLRKRVAQACARCGRNPEEVQIVAVTKTFPPNVIGEAVRAGQLDFGENYIKELEEKRKSLPNTIRWHFIGHLQRNKVKYIGEHIFLIHSVDNADLVWEIQKRAEKTNRNIDVLVEVHTTDEATKFGVAPDRTLELVREISKYNRVSVRGLMTMGPFSDDPDDSRPSFRKIADLRRAIMDEGLENVRMDHLSMGMSHDFEVGIEEGATIIRIGTAIFGPRQRN